MIADNKKFGLGIGMMIAFFFVLALIFMPLFDGQNGLEYLDDLYNSISKGSAYYIPEIQEKAALFEGNRIEVELVFPDDRLAQQISSLFRESGAVVHVSGSSLKVDGDLAQILAGALKDSDNMYHNDTQKIRTKYAFEARQALFNWWIALGNLEKALKDQNKFNAAKVASLVNQKAVETSFNYYGINPQKIMDKLGVVIFSLIFYVIYTLWFGFGIMYMFEGWGMRLEH